ncbi:hypothetical protein UFOVP938_55 [uncultured Caudovirales phage]|uniref:Uncharacterized protein n=1 Tax=uncultured Caudovirales phage TaxID=2100421 RepID=A0A6J5MZ07_9CAUD|nr:hypothetical protein UFOVP596_50 [uncultured Caudovirales phage]CAB4172712.1 hypothetical protein UFOVP938_55 [uncultured Caudovirales phage]CAB4183630.1 hypothetical protein UFOVP1104_46 [uncultured Caudovirales phage]CAB4202986.1 hypothetical protein UFOVP1371_59 [uncultured Caudovirales phage]CAB4214745.1 hypothetical protein UFOVP1468_6 [uncultured Caudovirales phage]
MSTFYDDGYTDATKGLKASPPAPYYRSDGVSTDVFAREYLEGYNDALRAIVNFHEVHESIKQDRKAGNEQ